jgi:hypothetical protein
MKQQIKYFMNHLHDRLDKETDLNIVSIEV